MIGNCRINIKVIVNSGSVLRNGCLLVTFSCARWNASFMNERRWINVEVVNVVGIALPPGWFGHGV